MDKEVGNMTSNREEPNGVAGGDGGFHRVQAERDLQSNWEVDLSQKLEEYLLKICSGEIPSESDGCVPVNFAEAALLLQGSVQVYSRKVEYLYSLVLRALDFLSQKRQQEQLEEGTSVQPQGNDGSEAVADEDNDIFWGLDDIPVESKTCLDGSSSKDALLDCFVKPPANLVVLEGDCLDSSGDAGELESYLLAASDLYRGFILLDPCDAAAVHDYLIRKKVGKGQNSVLRCSSNRKSFLSPTRRSGGTVKKSSLSDQDANISQSPLADCTFEANNCDSGSVPPAFGNYDRNHDFDMDDRCSEPGEFDDSDDSDDPWKPLNPHEPGYLKVKPFRKVKARKRNGASTNKQVPLAMLFPPAKLHGTISPELMKLWEMRCHAQQRQSKSQSPPLYEKLRQSLINDEHETFNVSFNLNDGNKEKGFDAGIPDFEQLDDDMPEDMYMDEDLPFCNHDEGGANSGVDEAFAHEYPNSHASLEELCRSHLDALLASIAETEKQSELAARVSTWKLKIEHNLDEQDSHPEFDIHDYGRRILDKLSHKADDKNVLSFADVVSGQEKYDVARSFSALLQLVNNGEVELEKSGGHGESVCYTALNPFHVRRLSHEKKQKAQFQLPRKRVKSPTKKACTEVLGENCETSKSRSLKSASKVYRSTEMRLQPNCKFSVKVGKIGTVCCTPDGKRRRRSRVVEPVDLHSAL